MTLSALTLRPDLHDATTRSHAGAEAKKLADATRQFEALLIRQILQQARQTVIPSKFAESSATSDIYKDMVNAEMAEAMSRSGGLGLAESLRRQLSRPTVTPPAPAPSPTSQRTASHD